MTAFRILAAEAWEALYRRKPPWRRAHWDALDDAERVCGSPEAAMESWRIFLQIRNRSYFTGHSPFIFAKHIEEFCSIPAVVPVRGGESRPRPMFRDRLPDECLTAWNMARLGNPIFGKHHGTIDPKGFCEHCRVFVWKQEAGPCSVCEPESARAL